MTTTAAALCLCLLRLRRCSNYYCFCLVCSCSCSSTCGCLTVGCYFYYTVVKYFQNVNHFCFAFSLFGFRREDTLALFLSKCSCFSCLKFNFIIRVGIVHKLIKHSRSRYMYVCVFLVFGVRICLTNRFVEGFPFTSV